MPFSFTLLLILLIVPIIAKLTMCTTLANAGSFAELESPPVAFGNDVKDTGRRIRETRSVINVRKGADALQKLISGATKVASDRFRYTNVYEKSGGLKAAISEFEALNPTQVETVSYEFGYKVIHGFVGNRYVQLAINGREGKPVITSLKLSKNEQIEMTDKIIYAD